MDGLRAVAILFVISAHSIDPGVAQIFGPLGHIGVLIFFALSGYLITTHLVREYDTYGRISLQNFYVRRIFRILPAAFFYLCTVLVLFRLGLIVCSWQAIRASFLFCTNYADLGPYGWRVAHFWSLSVEEHFYLFWPVLLIVCGIRKGLRTAAVLTVTIIVWRMLDDHFHILARIFHSPRLALQDGGRTDLIADALLWGCCLAFILRRPLRFSLSRWWSTAIALTAGATLVALIHGHAAHATILINILPAIVLGAVVVAPTAPIGRLLELPVMRFIGRLSYSLYLWQQLFLAGPGKVLPVPVALLVIFTCALFTYSAIERPCIRLGRSLLRQPLFSSQNSKLSGSRVGRCARAIFARAVPSIAAVEQVAGENETPL